jgi:hypothetical protein
MMLLLKKRREKKYVDYKKATIKKDEVRLKIRHENG